MKSNERLVYYFELLVGVNKTAASPPTLNEVIDRIEQAFNAGEASLELNKGTGIIQILDIEKDLEREIVTFYVRHSDKNGADVYFADPGAGTSRVERKRAGEGRGYGAHFVVSLTTRAGTDCVYAAMLEQVSGVNSSLIVRLLQSILRKMYQADPKLFVCDALNGARDRAGNPKKVGFRPMLDLRGLPSNQFVRDLEAGTVQEVQLIEEQNGEQLGARPWLRPDAKVMKFKVHDPGRLLKKPWEELNKLFKEQSEAEGYQRARIKFKRDDGETDSVLIDSLTGDMLDRRYVKSKRFSDIDPGLDECSDGIVDHFAELIASELVATR